MSDQNEQLTPQDRFLLSLPLEMRQRFLSDKHVDMPEIFSHVLIVDRVDGRVFLNPLNAFGGLTWHRGANVSDEVKQKINVVLHSFSRVEGSDKVEEFALIAASRISDILIGQSEKITGIVQVWFFEEGDYSGKVKRVIERPHTGDKA